MTRDSIIRAIIEAVVPLLSRKTTIKTRIGKDLWMTNTKKMKELAKKEKKK